MSENVISGGAAIPPVKRWLQAEGLVVFAASIVFYRATGLAWWIFVVFLLTPDLSMLAYLINPRAGALCYNVVHSYVGPLSAAALCVALHHMRPIPYLLIWTAHIGMDRALGYGLKYPEAFGRTHLGTMGKAPVKTGG
jgi:Domain of unknown function (DUF4260)